VQAFGETQLVVPTPGNTAERRNRRVELFALSTTPAWMSSQRTTARE
jgi:hypothetical protein